MKTRRFIALLALYIVWIAPAYGTSSGGYKAPADIIAKLPKYCWWQYVKGIEDHPEYKIQGCGSFANHYCPGLVSITEARRIKDKNQRINKLRGAKTNMEYTLKWTKNYPECIIREPAKINLEAIKLQLELLQLRRH